MLHHGVAVRHAGDEIRDPACAAGTTKSKRCCPRQTCDTSSPTRPISNWLGTVWRRHSCGLARLAGRLRLSNWNCRFARRPWDQTTLKLPTAWRGWERYDAVVAQALAKQPEERYATAEAFRAAILEAYAAPVTPTVSEETVIREPAVAAVLDPGTLDQLAKATGINPDELLAGLSRTLPGVVDRLTPNGRLPTPHEWPRLLQP